MVIFPQVSRIFQHKSIGTPIYFVVVKLVLLEKDPVRHFSLKADLHRTTFTYEHRMRLLLLALLTGQEILYATFIIQH